MVRYRTERIFFQYTIFIYIVEKMTYYTEYNVMVSSSAKKLNQTTTLESYSNDNICYSEG